ncbi:hypothetical protein Tco_1347014 [Tanacetum coccineum]
MRNKINLHTICDDSLLGTLKFVSKTEDSHKYGALIPDGMINQDIKHSKAYNTYYDFDTGMVAPKKARKFKKIASPSRKLSPVKEAESVKKAKRKKAPDKTDRGKVIELLLDAALLEDAQLNKALRKSRQDIHKLQASGSSEGADFESDVPDESKSKPFDTSEGTDVKPGVPEVSKANSSNSDNESWGNSEDESDDVNDDDNGNEDDDGNDAHDSERIDSDDDENPFFTLKDYEEEEHDEEYVHYPENYKSDDDKEDVHEEEDDDLYKDVDVKLLGAEYEKERKGDAEMIDADQMFLKEKSYEQVVEDAHVTLTSSQKTESSKQSSSVSSDFSTLAKSLTKLTTPSLVPTTVSTTTSIPALPDFTSLFGFDQRVSTLEKELSQLKQADHSAQLLESAKSQIPTISTINESLKNVILAKSSSQPKSTYEAAASLIKFELKNILLDKIEKSKLYQAALEHRELYDGLVKEMEDEKDTEPPKGSKSKESKSSSFKGTKPRPKSSGKSTQVDKPVFEVADTKMQQDQGSKFGHTVDQPDIEVAPKND